MRVSTEKGHFIVQLPLGPYRIDISKPGYPRFAAEILVREGETAPQRESDHDVALERVSDEFAHYPST